MNISRSILGVFVFLGGSLYAVFEHFFFSVYMKFKNHTHIVLSARVGFDSLVGKHVYIGHNSAVTKSLIWNYCSIASNVSIGVGEHDLDKISTNSIFYKNIFSELTKKPCIIENDVWIGVGSIVKRWVIVWNGAVIWTNSFVNKDVPPYAVVAWSPARIIKYRFTEDQIQKIIESKWWNYDSKKASIVMTKLETWFDHIVI